MRACSRFLFRRAVPVGGLVVAGIIVQLAPTGCASAPPTAKAPTLNADSRTSAPNTATEPRSTADRHAEQAARDVEAVLEMRRNKQALLDEIPPLPGFEDPAPAETIATQTPGGGTIAIQWNDAGNVRANGGPSHPGAIARRSQPGTKPGTKTTVAPPLAKDSPAPLVVEPLPVAGETDAGASEETSVGIDPGGSLEPAELRSLLVDVRRELNLQKPWSNQPLRELLAMAMLTLIDPELKINPEAFVDVTESERAIVASFQEFCMDLRERLDGSVEAEEAIAEAVIELRRALVREPELHLPTVALCWRVGGFGDYDEFDGAAFLAHAEQQFILYLEIDSFTSELNRKNQWVTEVSQQWELYHADDGIPVWSEPWQKAVDVTNKERRDFFTTQIVTLPKALSVGSYLLKIRVRDEKSGAEVEHSVEVEMVADPKLAVVVPE